MLDLCRGMCGLYTNKHCLQKCKQGKILQELELIEVTNMMWMLETDFPFWKSGTD